MRDRSVLKGEWKLSVHFIRKFILDYKNFNKLILDYKNYIYIYILDNLA